MSFIKNHKSFFIVLAISFIVFFSTVGFWAGFHMKFKIYQFVKSKIGLELKMGRIYVNPFTGNGYIKNIRIENPSGAISKNAFVIEEIRFEGDRKTFYADSIDLRHLSATGLEINFEPKADGSNFQQLYFDAMKYYNGNGWETDEWMKPLSVGMLDVEPITVNLGPKILNKKFVIPSISIDGLVGDEYPLTYRDFRDIVFGKYAAEIKKTLSGSDSGMNDEMKQRILHWISFWERRSE